MISHQKCQELIGLTMLIYDYVKKFKLNQSETIETFVSSQTDEELGEYTESRQEVLNSMKSCHMNCRIFYR